MSVDSETETDRDTGKVWYATGAPGKKVYHTDDECAGLENARNVITLSTLQASSRGLSECEHCQDVVDQTDPGRTRTCPDCGTTTHQLGSHIGTQACRDNQ